MAADNVVVEPGDMLLLHTGFATKVLEWNRDPDPGRSTRCAPTSTLATVAAGVDRGTADLGLVADNYAVEGLVGRDRDESRHSLLPIHHLCLLSLGSPSARCGTSTSLAS